jgi:dienelactone hydrolase
MSVSTIKLNFTTLLTLILLVKCSKLPDEDLLDGVSQQLTETNDFIILSPEEGTPKTTMIFYPGGLVDPHSYLKWQDQLVASDSTLQIITVKMPSNLAVINSNKGVRLFEQFTDMERWIISGHSLGGAMATNMIEEYPEKLKALIYLAAYPADDRIKDYKGGVLSISGENDGLTTPADIQDRMSDLPEAYEMNSILDFPNDVKAKTLYYQIVGGNHAQFGNYGKQGDDLEATITRDQQQNQLVELIRNYLIQL